MKNNPKIRSSNIEILRIIAMFMIVLNHLMVHGVLPGKVDSSLFSVHQVLGGILTFGGKLGVTVFIMITGYFTIKRNSVNIKSLYMLWSQVFTYSVVFFLLFAFYAGANHDFIHVASSFLPFIFNQYWFFTDYLIIMILSPVINAGLNNISQRQYALMLVFMFTIWFVIPSFSPFIFQRVITITSIELILLLFFYALGAYFAKYSNPFFEKSTNGFCLFSISMLAMAACITTIQWWGATTHNVQVFASWSQMRHLNSVWQVFNAMGLFLFFKNMDFGSHYWVNKIASATFGVYLIHDNKFVRDFLWHHVFSASNYMQLSIIRLFATVVLVSVFVFIISTLIELVRQNTFGLLNKVIANKISVLFGGKI